MVIGRMFMDMVWFFFILLVAFVSYRIGYTKGYSKGMVEWHLGFTKYYFNQQTKPLIESIKKASDKVITAKAKLLLSNAAGKLNNKK
jgi:hypothetical protein